MNYTQTIENLTEETVNKLSQAVETGRWENGKELTQEQKDASMQAIILWRARNSQDSDLAEPFVVDSDGELPIGKGRFYKPSSDGADDSTLIITKCKQ